MCFHEKYVTKKGSPFWPQNGHSNDLQNDQKIVDFWSDGVRYEWHADVQKRTSQGLWSQTG